jgi:hypothetical protein
MRVLDVVVLGRLNGGSVPLVLAIEGLRSKPTAWTSGSGV